MINDYHKGSLEEMICFYGSHHLLRPHGTMQGKARRAVVPFICKSKKVYILSRSMEADILKSKKDIYLVPEVWRSIFWKVKRNYILSRSMEADIFNKRISAYGCIL